MEEMLPPSMGEKWRAALAKSDFKLKFIIGASLLFIVLATFPLFFQVIEKRHGAVLNDWLLNRIPPYNMSSAIFFTIWAATAFTIFRILPNPDDFLVFLWTYVFISFSRMLSISLVALDPPHDIVELKDPIINNIYGLKIITRDLFYSGHTSSLFLMFLCLRARLDKIILLVTTIVVAFLLLIQHVHYTIDVLAALLFTYLIYLLTTKTIAK